MNMKKLFHACVVVCLCSIIRILLSLHVVGCYQYCMMNMLDACVLLLLTILNEGKDRMNMLDAGVLLLLLFRVDCSTRERERECVRLLQ